MNAADKAEAGDTEAAGQQKKAFVACTEQVALPMDLLQERLVHTEAEGSCQGVAMVLILQTASDLVSAFSAPNSVYMTRPFNPSISATLLLQSAQSTDTPESLAQSGLSQHPKLTYPLGVRTTVCQQVHCSQQKTQGHGGCVQNPWPGESESNVASM